MGVRLKSKKDIEGIHEGGRILHGILMRTAALAKPGISTWELNEYAENEIAKAGGKPAFKGYGPANNPFPTGLITSLNNVVVHGIPSKTDILQEGDILGLDLGMEYKEYYTDHAWTVAIGKVEPNIQKLLEVTEKALELGIAQAKVGNRIGDISEAIQTHVESHGFGVIKDLMGHGVGFKVHEEPGVPNYGQKGRGPLLEEGMVLAIEPMVSAGDYHVFYEDDGWTVSTADGSWSAHFEHTVAIIEHGPKILTA